MFSALSQVASVMVLTLKLNTQAQAEKPKQVENSHFSLRSPRLRRFTQTRVPRAASKLRLSFAFYLPAHNPALSVSLCVLEYSG